MVLRPVSSRKMRCSGLQWTRFRRHSARAILMSGRSCSAADSVFFIAESEPLQPMPQGRDAQCDPELLLQAGLEFAQRQIRLRGDPGPQNRVMCRQARPTVASALLRFHRTRRLVLLPKPLNTPFGNSEEARQFSRTVPLLTSRHNSLPQVFVVRAHPGTLPPNLRACDRLNRKCSRIGTKTIFSRCG